MRFTIPIEYRVLATMTLSLFAVGTVMYHWLEGFSYFNSLYLSVITLTTVGYGDIVPVTTAGKLFTIVYALVGIGVLVSFVSTVAQSRVHHRIEMREKRSDHPTHEQTHP
jgi:voltage-gated potassium channel